jgi:hypothetical protein
MESQKINLSFSGEVAQYNLKDCINCEMVIRSIAPTIDDISKFGQYFIENQADITEMLESLILPMPSIITREAFEIMIGFIQFWNMPEQKELRELQAAYEPHYIIDHDKKTVLYREQQAAKERGEKFNRVHMQTKDYVLTHKAYFTKLREYLFTNTDESNYIYHRIAQNLRFNIQSRYHTKKEIIVPVLPEPERIVHAKRWHTLSELANMMNYLPFTDVVFEYAARTMRHHKADELRVLLELRDENGEYMRVKSREEVNIPRDPIPDFKPEDFEGEAVPFDPSMIDSDTTDTEFRDPIMDEEDQKIFDTVMSQHNIREDIEKAKAMEAEARRQAEEAARQHGIELPALQNGENNNEEDDNGNDE